jgi:hypothetical protein
MYEKAQRHPVDHGLTPAEWEQAHEAIKQNKKLWSSLAIDGFQSDGIGGLIEHRRCPGCSSTISRRTTALEAVETLSGLAAVHARSLEAIVDAGAHLQGLKTEAA